MGCLYFRFPSWYKGRHRHPHLPQIQALSLPEPQMWGDAWKESFRLRGPPELPRR